MTSLAQLHAEIDERVQTIRANTSDWPCSKGCDSCCRQLADIPRLTEKEWDLLREGLSALPPDRLQKIGRDMAVLAAQAVPPVICPLLDQTDGVCPVYAQRPVPCRTYGFYVQRDRGLYCHDIEARVVDGAMADVVWGNHDGVDRKLAGLGENRTLSEWFECWKSGI